MKIKFRLLALFIICLLASSYGQEGKWAVSGGSFGSDRIQDIALDNHKNVYALATLGMSTFSTSRDTLYTGGCANLKGTGAYQLALIKRDSAGNCVFTKIVGTVNSPNIGHAICLDANNNIYITGSFSGTGKFGTDSFICAGTSDIFLAKFDADGNYTWSRSFGGQNNNTGRDIQTDEDGNVYLVGEVRALGVFDSVTVTSFGQLDGFLAKITPNGSVLWVKRIGKTNNDGFWGISKPKSGNFFITGYFNGVSVAFGGFSLTSHTGSDMFLAKMDYNGNFIWVKQAGNNLGYEDDAGSRVSTDEFGNIYVTGLHDSATVFGSITSTRPGFFLAKYDSSGNAGWVKQYPYQSTLNYTSQEAFARNGAVYWVGSYKGTMAFGPYSITSGSNNHDIYIAKFDLKGNPLWLKSIGNGANNETLHTLEVDEHENLYVGGTFSGADTVGASIIRSWPNNVGDYLLAKFSNTLRITGLSAAQVCKGDSFSVTYEAGKIFNSGNSFTIQLSDTTGSFTAPRTIGAISATTSGSIKCLVPDTVPAHTAYRLRIIASNTTTTGEVYVYEVPVNVYNGLTASAGSTGYYCGLSPAGAIDLTITGGTSPFSYVWSNSATTQDIANLGTGTYTVSVTDAHNCSSTLSAAVACMPGCGIDSLRTLCKICADQGEFMVRLWNIGFNYAFNAGSAISFSTTQTALTWQMNTHVQQGSNQMDLVTFSANTLTSGFDTLTVTIIDSLSGDTCHQNMVIDLACDTVHVLDNTNLCTGGLYSADITGIYPDEEEGGSEPGFSRYRVELAFENLSSDTIIGASISCGTCSQFNNAGSGVNFMAPGLNSDTIWATLEDANSPDITVSYVVAGNCGLCIMQGYDTLPAVTAPVFTGGDTVLCEGAVTCYQAEAAYDGYIHYSIVSGGAQIDSLTGCVSNVISSFTVRAVAVSATGNTSAVTEVTTLVNPLPQPPAEPVSQSICSDVAFTFNLTNIAPGLNGNQPQWRAGSAWGIYNEVAETDTIRRTILSGNSDTLWFRTVDTLTGCISDADYRVFEVNPYPVLNIFNYKPSLSSGDTTDIIAFSTLPADSITWYRDDTTFVEGDMWGTGDEIRVKLVNKTNTARTVHFYVMGSNKGCSSALRTGTLVIQPLLHQDIEIGIQAVSYSLCESNAIYTISTANYTTSTQGFTINLTFPPNQITSFTGLSAVSGTGLTIDAIQPTPPVVTSAGFVVSAAVNVHMAPQNDPPGILTFALGFSCNDIPDVPVIVNGGIVPVILAIGADISNFSGSSYQIGNSPPNAPNAPGTINLELAYPYLLNITTPHNPTFLSSAVNLNSQFPITTNYINSGNAAFSGSLIYNGAFGNCAGVINVNLVEFIVNGTVAATSTTLPCTVNLNIPSHGTLEIIEHVTIVGCVPNEGCQADFTLAWGCGSNTCKAIIACGPDNSNNCSSHVTVYRPFAAPDVIVSRILPAGTPSGNSGLGNAYAWDNSCTGTTTDWEYVVQNVMPAGGNGHAAYNIIVDLSSLDNAANYLSPYTYILQNDISTPDVNDSRFPEPAGTSYADPVVTLLSTTALQSSDFTDVPACFTGLLANSEEPVTQRKWKIARLEPGQSVVFKFKTYRCCADDDFLFGHGKVIFNRWRFQATAQNICGGLATVTAAPSGSYPLANISSTVNLFYPYMQGSQGAAGGFISTNRFDDFTGLPDVFLDQSFLSTDKLTLEGNVSDQNPEGCSDAVEWQIRNTRFPSTSNNVSDFDAQLWCNSATLDNGSVTGQNPQGIFRIQFRQTLSTGFSISGLQIAGAGNGGCTPAIVSADGIWVWNPSTVNLAANPPYIEFDMAGDYEQNGTPVTNPFATDRAFRDFFANSTLNFCVKACCGNNPDTDPDLFVETFFYPNNQTCSSCLIPVSRVHITPNIYCPGCATPGPVITQFTLQRSSLQFCDADNNGQPEPLAGGGLDRIRSAYLQAHPAVNTAASIVGDTISAELHAYIQDGGLYGGFNYADWQSWWGASATMPELYLQLDISEGVETNITALSATIDYFDNANTTFDDAVPVPTSSFTFSTQPVLIAATSIGRDHLVYHASASDFGALVEFTPHDHYIIKLGLRVCGNPQQTVLQEYDATLILATLPLTTNVPTDADYAGDLVHSSAYTGPATISPDEEDVIYWCEGNQAGHTIYPVLPFYTETWNTSDVSCTEEAATLKMTAGYIIGVASTSQDLQNSFQDLFPDEYRTVPGINFPGYEKGLALGDGTPMYLHFTPPAGYTFASVKGFNSTYYINGSSSTTPTLHAPYVTKSGDNFAANIAGTAGADGTTPPSAVVFSPPYQGTAINAPTMVISDEACILNLTFQMAADCEHFMDLVPGQNDAYAELPDLTQTCAGINNFALIDGPTPSGQTQAINKAISLTSSIVPAGPYFDWQVSIEGSPDAATFSNFVLYVPVIPNVTLLGISTDGNCAGAIPPALVTGTPGDYWVFQLGTISVQGSGALTPLTYHICMQATDMCDQTFSVKIHSNWNCAAPITTFPPPSDHCTTGATRCSSTTYPLESYNPIIDLSVDGTQPTCSPIAVTACIGNQFNGPFEILGGSICLPDELQVQNPCTLTLGANTDAAVTATAGGSCGTGSTLWNFDFNGRALFGSSWYNLPNGANTGALTAANANELCLTFNVVATCAAAPNNTLQGGAFVFSYIPACDNNEADPYSVGPLAPVFSIGANGCTPQATIAITTTPQFDCDEMTSNGVLHADVPAGMGIPVPTGYAWSEAVDPVTILSTNADLTVTATGVYTVTVFYDDCSSTATQAIINNKAVVISAYQILNVTCNGAATGGIDIEITGGIGLYTYVWSRTNNFTGLANIITTTQDLYNQAAGTYYIQVTSGGCNTTASFTINEPAAVTVAVTPANAACYGGTGSLTASPTGGTPGYTYAWSNAQTTAVITGLAPGGYTLTVTDAHLCTATATANVTAPNELTVSVTATNISCNGNADGSVEALPGGGTAPYTYNWSQTDNNPGDPEIIAALASGTYSVTLTDANNCTATATGVVTEPDVLSVTLAIVDETCTGLTNGSITATANGGTLPYTYNWNNTQTTATITGLLPNTYTVTITDNNNCETTASGSVSTAVILNFTAVATPECNGNGNGAVDITVSGGTSYSYAWSNSATSQDIAGVHAGNYTVTVTDVATGCSAVSGPHAVQNGQLEVTVTSSNPSPINYTNTNNPNYTFTYTIVVCNNSGSTVNNIDVTFTPPATDITIDDVAAVAEGFTPGGTQYALNTPIALAPAACSTYTITAYSNVVVDPENTEDICAVQPLDFCATASAAVGTGTCEATDCETIYNPVTGGTFNANITDQLLFVNNDITITSGNTVQIANSILVFGPGVKVTVNPGATLRANRSAFTACWQMWKGIELLANGALKATGVFRDCRFYDAHYAIELKPSAPTLLWPNPLPINSINFTCYSNLFKNNFVGIYVAPVNSLVARIINWGVFFDNDFTTGNIPLKQPYVGQNLLNGTVNGTATQPSVNMTGPNYNNWAWAGMDINNLLSFSDMSGMGNNPAGISPSQYSNLTNGLICRRVRSARVINSTFTNLPAQASFDVSGGGTTPPSSYALSIDNNGNYGAGHYNTKGYGIYFLGKFGPTLWFKLYQRGYGGSASPTFVDCQIGMHIIAAESDIRNNYMNLENNSYLPGTIQQTSIGISQILSPRGRIYNNFNHIIANHVAIAHIWNAPEKVLEINNNQLEVVHPSSMTSAAFTLGFGLYYYGNNTPANGTNLAGSIQNNTVDATNGRGGLGFTNAAHLLVSYNQIYLSHNSYYQMGWGINLENYLRIKVNANTIHCLDYTGDFGSSYIGIRTNQANSQNSNTNPNNNSEIICNVIGDASGSTDKVNYGIGMLGYNLGTQWRGNVLGGGLRGINAEPSTEINTQIDNGNLWEGTYSEWGAAHEFSGLSNIQITAKGFQQRFTVDPFVANMLTPAGTNVNDVAISMPTTLTVQSWSAFPSNPQWFFNGQPLGSEYQCPAPSTWLLAPSGDNTLTETEYTVINDEYIVGVHDEQMLWAMRRGLHNKLKNNAELRRDNDTISDYYDGESTTNVAYFNELQEGMAALYATDTVADSLANNIEALQNTVTWLDSALGNTVDSTLVDTLWKVKEYYVSLMAMQVNALDTLLTLQDTARMAIANNLATDNSSITAVEIFETNEQTVNDIYLRTLAQGNINFTGTDSANLLSIAAQCPLDGGTAVFIARGMYALLKDTIWDDEDRCNISAKFEGTQMGAVNKPVQDTALLIKIYPNPARDEVKVLFINVPGAVMYLQITDALGKKVQYSKVNTAEGIVTVNVQHLPAGVYLFKLTGASGISHQQKVTILK